MNQILYHYTDAEAFEGIITNKNLRMYTVPSDEKSELFLSKDAFIKIVEEALPDLGYLEPKVRKDLNKYINDSKGDQYENFRDNIYYASFTTEMDSKDHWNCRYGDSGKGLAIAFNREKLSEMYSYDCSSIPGSKVNEIISDTYMVYDDKDISKIAVEWLKNYLNTNPTNENYLDLMYFTFIVVTKNKEYAWAKEVRLFFNTYSIESIRSFCQTIRYTLPEALITVRSFLKNTKIMKVMRDDRKYREFHMDLRWESELIPFVIRGPECALSRETIRVILDQSGLSKTTIIDSKII